jgi:F420-0:gamma-glutamyl ligase
VNQALGVLIGAGLTQHEARAELDARATATGVDRHIVAAGILACLPGNPTDSAQNP